MLFIQKITVSYDKRRRSGEEMRKISALRFVPAPAQEPDLSGCAYYLHDNRFKKASVFPQSEHFKISERVYADPDSENYTIFYSPYTSHPAQRYFKPVMTLKDGAYGRIIYNERAVTIDGEWYYIRTTINLYSADAAKYRPKMFFRKEADQLFEDLAYLRYCGDYHKV